MKEMKEPRTGLREFTAEELKQFDGKDGRPLYIQFGGKVYDLSNSRLWIQGRHMGIHIRDENLTIAIKGAPHSEEVLSRFPIIGEFKGELLKAPIPRPIEGAVGEKPVEQLVQPPLLERRDFLKLVAVAVSVVTLIALASCLKILFLTPKQSVQLAWPIIKITGATAGVVFSAARGIYRSLNKFWICIAERSASIAGAAV